MKPVLFWTIRKGYWGRFYLMEVTTELGRRYWGRSTDGDQTNAAASQCRGRFGSVEQARAAMIKAQAIEDEYRKRIDEHEKAITALRHEREDAIKKVVDAMEATGS